MGVHSYHEGEPDFSPDAVLHSNCEECASRAGIRGLWHLDWRNARRVVERAVRWNLEGLSDTNETEAKLLSAVWSMLVFLQTNTDLDPIEDGLPWRDFEAMERRAFGGLA